MENNDFVFRKSSAMEETLVLNHLKEMFGSKTIQSLSNGNLWIKEGKIKEVFLIPEEQEKIILKLSGEIYYAGTPIGSIVENEFQLEIEGSSLILPFTNNKIKIKTSQFLYGKHIFVENLESYSYNFDKGDYLIILGKNNLHYGIGKAEIGAKDIDKAKQNTILVKGLKDKPLDRGWYLRRGN